MFSPWTASRDKCSGGAFLNLAFQIEVRTNTDLPVAASNWPVI
jgi:hypothetical protein